MKPASPRSPGTGQEVADRSGRYRQLLWASVPVWSFGFLAFAPFFYLAVIRRRIRDWVIFAAYLGVIGLSTALYFSRPDSGGSATAGGLVVLFMSIAAVHAFVAFRPGSAPALSPQGHARTSPPGPGGSQTIVDRSGRYRQLCWASVLVFSLGFLAFVPFFYLAVIRRQKWDWAVFAAYLAAVAVLITYFVEPGGSGNPVAIVLFLSLIGFGATHVFIVLRPGSFPAPWRGRRAAVTAAPSARAGLALEVTLPPGSGPAVMGPSGAFHEPWPSPSEPGVLLIDHVKLWRKRSPGYEITETGWLILTATGEVRFYKRLPADMTAAPDLSAPSVTEFALEIWDEGVRAHFGDQARNVTFTGAEFSALSEKALEDIGDLGESATSLGDFSSSQAVGLAGDAVSLVIGTLQGIRAIRARRRQFPVMRVWYPVLLGERPWRTLDVIGAWSPAISEQALDQARDQRDLAEAADQLAVAVAAQWEAEAAVRSLGAPFPLPVRWVAADACLADDWDMLVSQARSGAARAQSSPPDTWAAGPDELAGRGNHLVTVLAQVPTGRLVVLGEPGSGKTTLMVQLVLDLLASRASGTPVPVLAPLASWNPTERDLHDWLADQLAIDHPALNAAPPRIEQPNRIAALLSAGLILPILDGLDEIPNEVRGAAITQVNDSLRPGSQLILTCRAGPYRQTARSADGAEITVQAAAVIQLGPPDVSDVSRYLRDNPGSTGAPARWDLVLAALGTTAPAGQTLVTPLMVDLARTIYNPRPGQSTAELPDPAELCRLHDRAAVEAHLLDAFIAAVYRSRPASRWDARQAESWLVFLARHLETTIGGPVLAWWQLAKAGPAAGLKLAAGLVAALTAGVAAGLAVASTAGAAAGVAAGLVFGLGGALVSAVLAKRQKLRPFAGADRRAEVVLVVRIVAAGVAGIAIGQGLVHLSGSAVLGHLIGGAVIFLLACAAGGAYMNAGVPGDLAQAASPGTALARDRRAAFSAAVMFGFGLVLLVGTLVGIPVGALVGLVPGLVFGFAFPVFIGLCLSLLPAAWLSYALVRGWLALHRRLPWSLMDFLADAHQRGVLEQVGSVYRFRHTDLQHRLATRPRPTANSL